MGGASPRPRAAVVEEGAQLPRDGPGHSCRGVGSGGRNGEGMAVVAYVVCKIVYQAVTILQYVPLGTAVYTLSIV